MVALKSIIEAAVSGVERMQSEQERQTSDAVLACLEFLRGAGLITVPNSVDAYCHAVPANYQMVSRDYHGMVEKMETRRERRSNSRMEFVGVVEKISTAMGDMGA